MKSKLSTGGNVRENAASLLLMLSFSEPHHVQSHQHPAPTKTQPPTTSTTTAFYLNASAARCENSTLSPAACIHPPIHVRRRNEVGLGYLEAMSVLTGVLWCKQERAGNKAFILIHGKHFRYLSHLKIYIGIKMLLYLLRKSEFSLHMNDQFMQAVSKQQICGLIGGVIWLIKWRTVCHPESLIWLPAPPNKALGSRLSIADHPVHVGEYHFNPSCQEPIILITKKKKKIINILCVRVVCDTTAIRYHNYNCMKLTPLLGGLGMPLSHFPFLISFSLFFFPLFFYQLYEIVSKTNKSCIYCHMFKCAPKEPESITLAHITAIKPKFPECIPVNLLLDLELISNQQNPLNVLIFQHQHNLFHPNSPHLHDKNHLTFYLSDRNQSPFMPSTLYFPVIISGDVLCTNPSTMSLFKKQKKTSTQVWSPKTGKVMSQKFHLSIARKEKIVGMATTGMTKTSIGNKLGIGRSNISAVVSQEEARRTVATATKTGRPQKETPWNLCQLQSNQTKSRQEVNKKNQERDMTKKKKKSYYRFSDLRDQTEVKNIKRAAVYWTRWKIIEELLTGGCKKVQRLKIIPQVGKPLERPRGCYNRLSNRGLRENRERESQRWINLLMRDTLKQQWSTGANYIKSIQAGKDVNEILLTTRPRFKGTGLHVPHEGFTLTHNSISEPSSITKNRKMVRGKVASYTAISSHMINISLLNLSWLLQFSLTFSRVKLKGKDEKKGNEWLKHSKSLWINFMSLATLGLCYINLVYLIKATHFMPPKLPILHPYKPKPPPPPFYVFQTLIPCNPHLVTTLHQLTWLEDNRVVFIYLFSSNSQPQLFSLSRHKEILNQLAPGKKMTSSSLLASGWLSQTKPAAPATKKMRYRRLAKKSAKIEEIQFPTLLLSQSENLEEITVVCHGKCQQRKTFPFQQNFTDWQKEGGHEFNPSSSYCRGQGRSLDLVTTNMLKILPKPMNLESCLKTGCLFLLILLIQRIPQLQLLCMLLENLPKTYPLKRPTMTRFQLLGIIPIVLLMFMIVLLFIYLSIKPLLVASLSNEWKMSFGFSFFFEEYYLTIHTPGMILCLIFGELGRNFTYQTLHQDKKKPLAMMQLQCFEEYPNEAIRLIICQLPEEGLGKSGSGSDSSSKEKKERIGFQRILEIHLPPTHCCDWDYRLLTGECKKVRRLKIIP
ncbi:hypothetical protein VP01_513g1, partial [Puccinia sorghi]